MPLRTAAATGLLLALVGTTPLHAETITVCASGCDFTSINDAIDSASDGDLIRLAGETYREGEVIDTDGKAITLRGITDLDGDGLPETVLDGDGTHRVLICQNGETSETVLSQLLITGGFVSGTSFPDNNGGGILINNGSDPTLDRCTFSGNTAYAGGGIFIYASAPSFEACTLTDNFSTSAAGGIFSYFGEPVLSNCTISSNSTNGPGGGVYSHSGSPALTNCTISNNAGSIGGGLYSTAGSNPVLTGTTVCGNSPSQLVGAWQDGGDNLILEACKICPDADDDGVCDDEDQCPGEPDEDLDQDGTADCIDGCPDDPLKTAPGQCGCNEIDTGVAGDYDCDGDFDMDDYAAMGKALGACPGDVDGDGKVDGADLNILLGAWGVCP
jgi:hypothetical protein